MTIGEDNLVTIKGPKGTLSQKVHKDITVKHEGAVITVSRPSDAKPHKAMHGLYRALLHNLVVGVTNGFEKRCTWKAWAIARRPRVSSSP